MQLILPDAHMPFVRDLAGGPVLLYCRGDLATSTFGGAPYSFRAWQPAIRDLRSGEDRPLPSPFPSGIVCSPVMVPERQEWTLSVVAADVRDNEPARFGLYLATGSPGAWSPFLLQETGGPCSAGAVAFGATVWARKATFAWRHNGQERRATLAGVAEILRLCPWTAARWLATVRLDVPEPAYVSLQLNLGSGAVEGEIVAPDGEARESLYKCSLYGDRVYHARRSGEDWEDRSIWVAPWELVPSPIALSVEPVPRPPRRPGPAQDRPQTISPEEIARRVRASPDTPETAGLRSLVYRWEEAARPCARARAAEALRALWASSESSPTAPPSADLTTAWAAVLADVVAAGSRFPGVARYVASIRSALEDPALRLEERQRARLRAKGVAAWAARDSWE